jgi:hypothetical protein
MQKLLPFFGIAGLICGIVCATSAFLPGVGVFISMIAMVPGFLLSSLYVMFATRYEVETPKINPGYIGMALSSTPLLLFIFFFLTSGN